MTTGIVSWPKVTSHVMWPLQELYVLLFTAQCKSKTYPFVEKIKIDGKRKQETMCILE